MGSGDPREVQLAAAALGIALAALAIAITQLLGQLFATADGYRRCQPSVMGAWAKHTKLRWKWSEMRFETLFQTPEIFLLRCSPVIDSRSTVPQQEIKWVGSFPGSSHFFDIAVLDSELVDPSLGTGLHHEMACWLPLLKSIREHESELDFNVATDFHNPQRSACRFVQRSWDFMAPELVRPPATTYVGDIAIIVQRLGMTWQVFRPEDGEMRAEGNGHIIYSTLDRSIGPILHYAYGQTHSVPFHKHDIYSATPNLIELPFILTAQVDMMRFGLLRCDTMMNCRCIAMGTIAEVRAFLNVLDPTGTASKKVHDNRNFEPTATFGFPDLISMAAPVLRHKGSCNIRLPVPTEHCTGLTSHKEGFVVFHRRLGEYVASEGDQVSEHVLWVFRSYDIFKRKYYYWEEGIDASFSRSPSNVSFLDEVHEVWDQTTKYFQNFNGSEKHRLSYRDLVACHTKHAVHFWHEAHEHIREGKAREHYGLCDWLAEGMHLYWDYLPKIVDEMASKSSAPASLVREAWIMLMFRAFCWSRCHYLCRPDERFPDSTRLPSRYWNSKLPVYLG